MQQPKSIINTNYLWHNESVMDAQRRLPNEQKDAFCIYDTNSLPEEGVLLIDKVSGNLSICDPSFMERSAPSQKTSPPKLTSMLDVLHSVDTCEETMNSDSSFRKQIIQEMLQEETTDGKEGVDNQKTESMSDNLAFNLKSQTCNVIPRETSLRSGVKSGGDGCSQRGSVHKSNNCKSYFLPPLRRTQISNSRAQIEIESLNPLPFQNKQFQKSITSSLSADPVVQENAQGRRVFRTSLKGSLSDYTNPSFLSQRIREMLSEETAKSIEAHRKKMQVSSAKVVPPLNLPISMQISSSETRKLPKYPPVGHESARFLPKRKNSCRDAKDKNVSNCEPPAKIIKRQSKSRKAPGEGWPQVISVQEDALSLGSRNFEQLLASFSSPEPIQKVDLQHNATEKKRVAEEIEIIDVEDFSETGGSPTNNSVEMARTENTASEIISSCTPPAPQCNQIKGFDTQYAILCEPNTQLDVGNIPLQKVTGQNVLIIIPNDITPIISDNNNIVPVQLKNNATITALSKNVGIAKIPGNSYQISNVIKTNVALRSFRPEVSQDKSVKAIRIKNIRSASDKLIYDNNVHSINSLPIKKWSYRSLITKRNDNVFSKRDNNVVPVQQENDTEITILSENLVKNKISENGYRISCIKKTSNEAPTMTKDNKRSAIRIQDIRNASGQLLYDSSAPNVNSHPVKKGMNNDVSSSTKDNSVAEIRHDKDNTIQNQPINEFSAHTSSSKRTIVSASGVKSKGNKLLAASQNAAAMKVCSERDKSALIKNDNKKPGTTAIESGLVSASNAERCSNGNKPDTAFRNEFFIPPVNSNDNQMIIAGVKHNLTPVTIEDALLSGPRTTECVKQKEDPKSTMSDDIYPYEYQICSQCSKMFLTLTDPTENRHPGEVDELPKMCKKCCVEINHANYLNPQMSQIMNKPNLQRPWSPHI